MVFLMFVTFVDGVGFKCGNCAGVVVIHSESVLDEAAVANWRRRLAGMGWQTSNATRIDVCPTCQRIRLN